jgi:hypothetical protein
MLELSCDLDRPRTERPAAPFGTAEDPAVRTRRFGIADSDVGRIRECLRC